MVDKFTNDLFRSALNSTALRGMIDRSVRQIASKTQRRDEEAGEGRGVQRLLRLLLACRLRREHRSSGRVAGRVGTHRAHSCRHVDGPRAG